MDFTEIDMQVNGHTGEAYKGENQMHLQVAKREHNYDSSEWYTYLQAKEHGWKVQKGQHGIRLTRVIEDTVKDNKTGVTRPRFGLRHFTVFNFDQMDI